MWPVMTLTLLLQLTDDEQLYAQETTVKEKAAVTEAPAQQGQESTVAAWPVGGEADC